MDELIKSTMHISELISLLTKFKHEYGDAPVLISNSEGKSAVSQLFTTALISISRKGENIGIPAILLMDYDFQEAESINSSWTHVSGTPRIKM